MDESRRRADVALWTILLAAAVVRLVGLKFGLPHLQCRPDETSIASIATSFYQGTFNPHFFNYPALFMSIVAGVLFLWLRLGWLLGYVHDTQAMNALVTPATVQFIARLASATAGVATVWIVFRIGRRLFDRPTALVASFFLAIAFLHVRDSHFGVTDVAATCAAALAFLLTVRLNESARTLDLIAAAAVAGLAASTKYNVALVAIPALLAIAGDATRSPARRASRAFAYALIMCAAFLAASPYTVIAWPSFVAAMRFESTHLAAGHGRIVGRGWIVHLTTTLRYGLGGPMLAAAIAGLAWLAWRRPRVALLIGSFPVVYFVTMGSGYTVFARYMLPIVPWLCITAAVAAMETARWCAERARRPGLTAAFVAAIATLIAAPSAMSVLAFDRLLSRADSRLIAASWIEQRFPRGATIAEFGPEGGHVFVGAGDPAREALYTIRPLEVDGPRPDVIVVQRSPLTGEEDLGAIASVIEREYVLAADLEVASSDPRNVYDAQDEFYLPLSGFAGIDRPGPNLRIFVRRDRQRAS